MRKRDVDKILIFVKVMTFLGPLLDILQYHLILKFIYTQKTNTRL